jgi:hypothetical protein
MLVEQETRMDRSVESRLHAAKERKRALLASQQTLRLKLNETQAGLAACDREIALCEAAEQDRRRGIVAVEDVRRAIRQLGTFTVSELAATLGVSTATARKRLREAEEAGMAIGAGRSLGQSLYRYVKPEEVGEEFKRQQERRLALVPAPMKPSQPVAGTGANTWDTLAHKDVRAAVKEAVLAGWRLITQGDGHYRLVKDGRKVPVYGTPSNPSGHAESIRRATRLRAS